MDGTMSQSKEVAAENSKHESAMKFMADAQSEKTGPVPGKIPVYTGDIPPYLIEEMHKRGDKSAQATINALKEEKPDIISGKNGKPQGEREVYDAKFGFAQPGSKARFEGEGPSGIPDADKVYDYTGIVRDFYKNVFGRNSIDDQGMKVISTVNYGDNVPNAFWDSKQMWYGHPGAGSPFNTFVLLDVTGHEMTHGVTESDLHLWQWQQAGALHEHLSDVFGELVEQYAKHETAEQADWLHGAGAFKSSVKGRAIRDMLNPGTAYDDPKLGKDPQRGHMKDLYVGWNDNGGVHINSGIPNRAFALFARSVGGFAWEDPGHIWYNARKPAGQNPTFAQFAYHTIEQAKLLNKPGLVEKLEKSWADVGVVPSKDASPSILSGGTRHN